MNNRRDFLKIAGLGVSGAILKPLNSDTNGFNVRRKSIKIGVLLPGSSQNNAYSTSYLNGLRLGITNGSKSNTFELITEHIKHGGPYVSQKKAVQLIVENKVDVMAGIINPISLQHFHSLYSTHKIPGIFSNAGENLPTQSIKDNPYLFFNTLNLAQSSYEMGKIMVQEQGKNVVLISGNHEGGYQALTAFKDGVEFSGGELVKMLVFNDSDLGFVEKAISELEKVNPSAVYLLLNNNQTAWFCSVWKHSKLKNVKIYGSAFAAEDSRLVETGSLFNGIKTINQWFSEIRNEANQHFINSYKDFFRILPNSFSVLGYETGQLIAAASGINSFNTGKYNVKALAETKINSPRGKIIFNSDGEMQAPFYYTEINSAFTESKYTLIKNLGYCQFPNKALAENNNELYSGLINPYLFA